jgi:hypothetical protein
MRLTPVAPIVALVVLLAGCGGSGSSANKPSTAVPSQLVGRLDHPTIKIQGDRLTGSVQATYGGKPGQRLTLAWGLVDAVTGVRASKGEEALAHPVTTAQVVTKTYDLDAPRPTVPTDYIVHYALYGPDGIFLSGKDSSIFTIK